VTLQFTVLADLHLRATEPYDTGSFSRVKEKLQILRDAVSRALLQPQKLLFLAGDIFDARESPAWLRAAFLKELTPCFTQELEVYLLVGNHETNSQVNTFADLQMLDRMHDGEWPIHIITEPTSLSFGGVLFHLVPYGKADAVISAVTEWAYLKESTQKVLIGHFDVDGAEQSGGNAFQIPTKLRQHHFEGYDLVILGHIHQRQIHIGAHSTWTYVGSPLCQDFGERADASPKGFYEVAYHPEARNHVQAPGWEFQTVPTKSTPLVQVEVHEGTEGAEWGVKLPEHLQGNICKVIFIGSAGFLSGPEVQSWKKLCRALEKDGTAVRIFTELRCTDRELTQVEETPEVRLDDSMERLCTEKDQKDLLPDGKRFMEEAHNALAQS